MDNIDQWLLFMPGIMLVGGMLGRFAAGTGFISGAFLFPGVVALVISIPAMAFCIISIGFGNSTAMLASSTPIAMLMIVGVLLCMIGLFLDLCFRQ